MTNTISGTTVLPTASPARRWVLAAVAIAALAIPLLSAVPANAANPATVMVQTQRMSDATLNSSQNGWYAKGSKVTLVCFKRGQSVKGYFSRYVPGGWDNLWYKVNDGYFIADIDIDTGSNNPITPECGVQTVAPPPSSVKTDRAVAWANSMVGSMGYPGLCERFVENAYGTSGKYATAIAAYNALKSAGAIKTSTTNIPKGALVFSSYYAYDLGSGHVEISRGDNTFVSGGASTKSGNRTTVQVYTGVPAGYLGWAMPPSSWPGR